MISTPEFQEVALIENSEPSRKTEVHVHPIPRARKLNRDPKHAGIEAYCDNFRITRRDAINGDRLELDLIHGDSVNPSPNLYIDRLSAVFGCRSRIASCRVSPHLSVT